MTAPEGTPAMTPEHAEVLLSLTRCDSIPYWEKEELRLLAEAAAFIEASLAGPAREALKEKHQSSCALAPYLLGLMDAHCTCGILDHQRGTAPRVPEDALEALDDLVTEATSQPPVELEVVRKAEATIKAALQRTGFRLRHDNDTDKEN